ncbi:hypothetical protein BD413DRAFT_72508 [Trametes elegans]|nr:hypothetical protein BD413DRAFT_72508 [Trametes elegans]
MFLRTGALLLLFDSLLALTASPFAPLFASAALVNVTIDDTFGDQATGNQITYGPPGVWKAGQNCTDCTAKVDPAQVSNGTWHDGTFSTVVENNSPPGQILTAAVSFNVAVYVFCVVTGSSISPDGNSDMSFYIDGEEVGDFVRPPDGDSSYRYNFLVYANESLDPGEHSFVIVNGGQETTKSLTLLDYIVYTREMELPPNTPSASDPISSSQLFMQSSSASAAASSTPMTDDASTPNTSQKRTITIAVATVCGVLGLAAVIVALSYYCIRKRHRSTSQPDNNGIIPHSPSHIEVNPAASGWTEGTWAEDEEGQQHSSLATSPSQRRAAGALGLGSRRPSGKRARGDSDSRVDIHSDIPATQNATWSPPVPSKALPSIPTFRIPHSQMAPFRGDVPGSPASSSWGTPAHMAPPDSATFLLSPTGSSSTSNVNLNRIYTEASDSTNSLSSHNAHPFAKAQAAAPTPATRARSRSDTTKPASHPPPSALPLRFTNRARGNSASKAQPGPETLSSATTSPTTPASAPYTVDTDDSFLPSPSPADPSPLAQAAAERPPEQQQLLRPPEKQQQLRPSPSHQRRRVDPVDPSLQPPRDLPPTGADRTHPRGARSRPSGENRHGRGRSASQSESRAAQQAAQAEAVEAERTLSQRARRRQGVLDVPVDAAGADSPPPSYSYRELG